MYKPIIPWLGGKRRLAKQILPLYPAHTCYVEPFAGGAACLFLKPPSKVEVINDIHGELVNLYRIVQNHPEELIRQFKWALSSRTIFKWEKMKRPETLTDFCSCKIGIPYILYITDIQRAARFFYLQKLAFGGRVTGQSFGSATTAPPKLNLLRLEEDLSQAHLRLSGVLIENLPWQEVINRYDRAHTLFFCDPPYWKVAGYGVDFPLDNYQQLAEFARTIKGKMIITLNDHPDMRELFAGFNIKTAAIHYSCGAEKKRKTSTEMIITHF